MTLAYTGTLSPPISTKKSQEDIVDDDETQDSASPDQDHGGVTSLSQPTQDVAHSDTTPIASPRFGNPQSRSAPGHPSQRHSKSVSFVDKSKRRSLSIPPKRRSLSIPPIANETPSSSDGYASGTVESSFPLESEVHSLSESAILTVTLICAGLSTPVFFSQATTDTTKSNQFHRLPIKVKNIVESKSDLTDFALSYQKDIRIFNCLRKLVLALESGALTREELYTAIVEGTFPWGGAQIREFPPWSPGPSRATSGVGSRRSHRKPGQKSASKQIPAPRQPRRQPPGGGGAAILER